MRTLLLVSLYFLQTQHVVAVMQNHDYPNLVQEARREYLNGQFRNSEKLFLDALRSLDKSNQDERAMVLAELGNVYVGLDLPSKAERAYTESLAIYRRLVHDNVNAKNGVAIVLCHLGSLYSVQRRYDDALKLLREALKITAANGSEHAALKVEALNTIGIVYHRQGNQSKADESFNQALQTVRDTGIAYDTSELLTNLGIVYHAKRQFEKAEDVLKRALSAAESHFGSAHPSVIPTLTALALIYEDAGKYAEAEGYYQRALDILSQRGPEFETRIARLFHALSRTYTKAGRRSEAERMLADAAEIARRNLSQHPELAGIVEDYSAVLKQQGKTKEAEELRVEARRARVTAGLVISAFTPF